MILFRAMCDAEANSTLKNRTLDYNTKFKWFGTEEFVKTRVQDGKFNNSKFVDNRYNRLLKFEVTSGHEHLINCGKNEYMLSVRKLPLVKINLIGEIL